MKGAQSREPEALGAVVLATSSTCLIVAGEGLSSHRLLQEVLGHSSSLI